MRYKLIKGDGAVNTVYFPEYNFYSKDKSDSIIKLINYIIGGKECFFGFYREDGAFENDNELTKFKTAIPQYFEQIGSYVDLTLEKFKNKKDFDKRISAIGRLS